MHAGDVEEAQAVEAGSIGLQPRARDGEEVEEGMKLSGAERSRAKQSKAEPSIAEHSRGDEASVGMESRCVVQFIRMTRLSLEFLRATHWGPNLISGRHSGGRAAGRQDGRTAGRRDGRNGSVGSCLLTRGAHSYGAGATEYSVGAAPGDASRLPWPAVSENSLYKYKYNLKLVRAQVQVKVVGTGTSTSSMY